MQVLQLSYQTLDWRSYLLPWVAATAVAVDAAGAVVVAVLMTCYLLTYLFDGDYAVVVEEAGITCCLPQPHSVVVVADDVVVKTMKGCC